MGAAETLEALHAEQNKLMGREKELGAQLQSLTDRLAIGAGVREHAQEVDRIHVEVRTLRERRAEVSRQYAETKDRRRAERIEKRLHSAEYREAVARKLASLAVLLDGWIEPPEEREIPAASRTMALLVAENREWLQRLVRLGVVEPKSIPPALRSLVEVPK